MLQGDKTYAQPELLLVDVLKQGLENVELRSEIYCQIVKQLTQNPNGPSMAKGWDAMLICLATFPPRQLQSNKRDIDASAA